MEQLPDQPPEALTNCPQCGFELDLSPPSERPPCFSLSRLGDLAMAGATDSISDETATQASRQASDALRAEYARSAKAIQAGRIRLARKDADRVEEVLRAGSD
jgi:hypothetical protein